MAPVAVGRVACGTSPRSTALASAGPRTLLRVDTACFGPASGTILSLVADRWVPIASAPWASTAILTGDPAGDALSIGNGTDLNAVERTTAQWLPADAQARAPVTLGGRTEATHAAMSATGSAVVTLDRDGVPLLRRAALNGRFGPGLQLAERFTTVHGLALEPSGAADVLLLHDTQLWLQTVKANGTLGPRATLSRHAWSDAVLAARPDGALLAAWTVLHGPAPLRCENAVLDVAAAARRPGTSFGPARRLSQLVGGGVADLVAGLRTTSTGRLGRGRAAGRLDLPATPAAPETTASAPSSHDTCAAAGGPDRRARPRRLARLDHDRRA